MSQIISLTKDTWLIITAIAIAAVIVIGTNRTDMSEVRMEIRELRGLLIAHIAGHNHLTVVADNKTERAE